jgi:uncharacterized membrane protein
MHRRDWVAPAGLIALSLVPAAAGAVRLTELARGSAITPANARFFAMPLPVILHILAVVPYSIFGALQFAPRLRQQRRVWHRLAGYVLIPCGIVTAISGLWMTQFYPWPDGDGRAVYLMRLVVGSAMLAFILAGIDAIRRRNFTTHGAWMTRAYAIAMGAGTQVVTHLPWFLFVGKPGEDARALLMGAGWIINILVAERVIRRAHTHSHSTLTPVVS